LLFNIFIFLRTSYYALSTWYSVLGTIMHDSQTPCPTYGQFAVLLANRQSRHAVNETELIAAAQSVLNESHFSSGNVSVAVVDDETIHELNRHYLNHDWPTDVLSFVLDGEHGHLEGEVIISADTAATSAAEIGWSAAAEQLLYVIHGMLHLVGCRDKTAADKKAMRAAEVRYLRQFGLEEPGARSHNGVPERKPRRPLRRGAKLR
jgi:probable rRNA maturation factor